MKVKIAKRSASDYEESLSSHGSCQDSIMTHHQMTSLPSSSSLRSCILIAQDCFTPPKNTTQNQRSYSLKKLPSGAPGQWKESDQIKFQQKYNFWVHESEDSKIRKKQDNYCQSQSKKFKQHIKVLKFQDQLDYNDHEKQNQPFKQNKNLQQSSSDQQMEQIYKIRSKNKRVVGMVLFMEQNQPNKFSLNLPQIPQESQS